MIRKVLIATDGSKHSDRAADAGIEIAGLFGADVTAVYVIDTSKEYGLLGELGSRAGEEMLSGIRQGLRSQGSEAVDRVVKSALARGLAAQSKVVEGRPADEILSLAKDVDLVVVGGIGVSGLEKFLLGSVAEKVVRGSPAPVLVVRAK